MAKIHQGFFTSTWHTGECDNSTCQGECDNVETKGVFISINGVIGGGAIAEFQTYREAQKFVEALKRKAAALQRKAQ